MCMKLCTMKILDTKYKICMKTKNGNVKLKVTK